MAKYYWPEKYRPYKAWRQKKLTTKDCQRIKNADPDNMAEKKRDNNESRISPPRIMAVFVSTLATKMLGNWTGKSAPFNPTSGAGYSGDLFRGYRRRL